MANQAQGRSESNGGDHGRKQRPVWTKKVFALSVAVFEFPTDNGPPNFRVKLTRMFRRDEESDWENSEYLGAGDLLRAAKLLGSADTFVQSRLEACYRTHKVQGENV